MNQTTLRREFRMTGMGLHTGRTVTVSVRPAQPDYGIAFRRTDRFNMSGMFSFCSSLTSLNLSNFNTNNVTDMRYMFSDCSSLTSLNLSNFNTNNVTNMSKMFSLLFFFNFFKFI